MASIELLADVNVTLVVLCELRLEVLYEVKLSLELLTCWAFVDREVVDSSSAALVLDSSATRVELLDELALLLLVKLGVDLGELTVLWLEPLVVVCELKMELVDMLVIDSGLWLDVSVIELSLLVLVTCVLTSLDDSLVSSSQQMNPT